MFCLFERLRVSLLSGSFDSSILLEVKPPTGEPYAGDPPVRFGGRGSCGSPYPYPYPYGQAPRCGGESGVSVPSKSHLSAKRVFHGRNFVTAGISTRVVVWARPKMSNLQCPPLGKGGTIREQRASARTHEFFHAFRDAGVGCTGREGPTPEG